jgi:hypothetical protein
MLPYVVGIILSVGVAFYPLQAVVLESTRADRDVAGVTA